MALPCLLLHSASAETVPLAQAPSGVQKTIKERLGNAQIEDVDRDLDSGKVIFTITFGINGQSREMTLGEDGHIVSAQVFLKDLSLALQMAIQRVAAADAIERIEKVLEENPEYYSIDWKARDGQAHSFDVWESGKIKSMQVTLDEVPAAVRAGLQKQAGSDAVKTIAKSFEEADVQYVATLDHGGHERDLTVSEAGELLRMDIALADAPATVQQTVTSTASQGAITSIEKVVDDGHLQYEVEWKTKEGAARSFTVLESGKLLSMRVSLEETPPAVRAAIAKEIGGDKLKEVAKSFDDGVAYDVTVNRNGRDRDFSLRENGQISRVEVSLAEIPPIVQKGIQHVIGTGSITSIDRTVEDDRTQYNIDWKASDGTAHAFSLLENGSMKSVRVALEETPPAVNAAIVPEVGSGKLKEIARSFDDNAVTYDVTFVRDGRERDFTVTEAGKLERRQLFLEELAAAAQGTIKRVTAKGMILRIDQMFNQKKGGFHMEVESLVDGKQYDFNVGQNGLFLGVEKP
ncbi:hypothetical protein CfE428DRAFT_3138 [Chthoniobacter flavus Ellin428]|uniref:Putative beta-lactamase-inhibitor-like PepSY-like domain-containing protein n=2 Tax=Chthoniobacter flavus TaxID=191863 RepID=B4D2L3_9BACT|nr:hypothetical protein CfE428DRAFT_3138 [Chthoniobacter flavus Ellin428]TCO90421.1 hypothetical protein EV701_11044 [Chthoniobacter flavus]